MLRKVFVTSCFNFGLQHLRHLIKMGCSLSISDKIEPRELHEVDKYYKRPDSDDSNELKRPHFRSTTDIPFLIMMTMFFVILMGLLIYCVLNGDLYRILNGYDSCANVCGRNNERNSNFQCTDKNMKDKPYLLINGSIISHSSQRQCVENCTKYFGYKTFLNRCFPEKGEKGVNKFFSKTGLKNFFEEVAEDLQSCWKEILYLCIVAFTLSLTITILLRYLVGIVVWIVLIGVSLACCTGTIYLWILWNQSDTNMPAEARTEVDSRKITSYLFFAILATVVTILVLLVILVMRKHIQLVIQLFKEAGKAIASMPLLLFEPVLTFSSLAVMIGVWFYFSLWIESAGFLTEHKNGQGFLRYDKNFLIKFTRWFNLLGMLWMAQFIIACQHMVIAGSISIWYFTRMKNKLDSPILTSFHNLTRYHLGSVALGSLIIAIIQLLRIILKVFEKHLKTHDGKCVEWVLKCCQCCLYCFERIIKYLNRNAYIEIAIYGYSFCTAGKQAFKLLVANALRVTAINSVGDFVLFLGKVLVVMATVVIGIEILQDRELQHLWVPITLIGIFAYFVSHCFITVYEMAIDTIFICFCEDCVQNDGVTKPYYMSRGLMEFVENSKKALLLNSETVKNRNEGLETISESVSKN